MHHQTLGSNNYLIVKAACFIAAFMPILVSTVRRGTIPNAASAVLLAAGLVFTTFEAMTGRFDHDVLRVALQIVCVSLVLFGIFVLGWMGAGAAKLCVAVVPWFTLDEYFGALALTFGMILFEARLRQTMKWQQRTIQYAPPVALAGCIVLLSPLFGR